MTSRTVEDPNQIHPKTSLSFPTNQLAEVRAPGVVLAHSMTPLEEEGTEVITDCKAECVEGDSFSG